MANPVGVLGPKTVTLTGAEETSASERHRLAVRAPLKGTWLRLLGGRAIMVTNGTALRHDLRGRARRTVTPTVVGGRSGLELAMGSEFCAPLLDASGPCAPRVSMDRADILATARPSLLARRLFSAHRAADTRMNLATLRAGAIFAVASARIPLLKGAVPGESAGGWGALRVGSLPRLSLQGLGLLSHCALYATAGPPKSQRGDGWGKAVRAAFP